jgi:hypothetical protein
MLQRKGDGRHNNHTNDQTPSFFACPLVTTVSISCSTAVPIAGQDRMPASSPSLIREGSAMSARYFAEFRCLIAAAMLSLALLSHADAKEVPVVVVPFPPPPPSSQQRAFRPEAPAKLAATLCHRAYARTSTSCGTLPRWSDRLSSPA